MASVARYRIHAQLSVHARPAENSRIIKESKDKILDRKLNVFLHTGKVSPRKNLCDLSPSSPHSNQPDKPERERRTSSCSSFVPSGNEAYNKYDISSDAQDEENISIL